MSDPFIGEIKIVGFNFAPRNWAQCNGQLLPISQNSALFSLLGTIYGGDGRTTFALPDLRGRAAIHYGQGAGLSNRRIGERDGTENVLLTVNQIPAHNHTVKCKEAAGNAGLPAGKYPAGDGSGFTRDYSDSQDNTLAGDAVNDNGGSETHNNMPPHLTVNFCIALQGVFPSRS